MCGYGAPSGRCVWRPSGGHHHYSTCVPSLDTCPNEECDEDLENIVHSLCPQDCAKTLTINDEVLNIKGISITTRGLCYCKQDLHCTCVPEDQYYNGTFVGAPFSKLPVDFGSQQVAPRPYTDTKWEIPRDNLHLENVIGEGEFGRVVKGQAVDIHKQQGPITVAVKMLK
ncbi:hypothetical protein LSH36_321g08004, partial [Paralvinella palmiformis]